jgi:hypothetical protein
MSGKDEQDESSEIVDNTKRRPFYTTLHDSKRLSVPFSYINTFGPAYVHQDHFQQSYQQSYQQPSQGTYQEPYQQAYQTAYDESLQYSYPHQQNSQQEKYELLEHPPQQYYAVHQDPNQQKPDNGNLIDPQVYVLYDPNTHQSAEVVGDPYQMIPTDPVSASSTTLGHNEERKKMISSTITKRKYLLLALFIFLVVVGGGIALYFGLAGQHKSQNSTPTPPSTPTTTALSLPTNVTTFAGSGRRATDDGTGVSASFNEPVGLVLDSVGNLFVTEPFGNVIRRVSSAGVVTTFAGSSSEGSSNGMGAESTFRFPVGITVDKNNNVYVADRFNHLIRRIDPTGRAVTFAGSGRRGGRDGQGTSATFDEPNGISFDSQGNLYVVEYAAHKIRRISPSGDVFTFAGTTSTGFNDGAGTIASFHFPAAIAVDSQDNIYVSDSYNHAIRKISTSGLVSTFVGSGKSGRDDGRGSRASFFFPGGLSVDRFDHLYVADYGNNLIRKVTSDGVVTTLSGSGSAGKSDGNGTVATFDAPNGVAITFDGSVYVADQKNNIIRKLSP